MQGENNVFNPTDLELSRSSFGHSPTETTTMNAGRLYPLRFFWVQPGDSIRMDVQSLFKMSTPVYPTMDRLFADIFFFFVPHKLVLGRRYGSPSLSDSNESWKAIIGAQDNLLNMPIPASGLKVPTFKTGNSSTRRPNTLLDYFPVTPGSNLKLNVLPLLSYFAIWNENFRDPNLMSPVTWAYGVDADSGEKYVIPYGDVPLYATNKELVFRTGYTESTPDYYIVNALGSGIGGDDSASTNAEDWLPFPVCRFHGYFGSALPWPQRNTDGVMLPLGESAPVFAGDNHVVDNSVGIHFVEAISGDPLAAPYPISSVVGSNGTFLVGDKTNGTSALTERTNALIANNLWADLTEATAANVNALRFAIQQQRWYEKLARSGNRYDELEYGLFGVRPHDSGEDRPVYLGGKRIPLQIEMVASTQGGSDASSGEGSGSLGALGAFSHTNDQDNMFYHSFDDWGIVMCLVCIRHHDTFGTGTDRFWTKRTRDDLYFPTFAHLGEQPVYEHELTDDDGIGDQIFGYMPAWSEYRNELDHVSGLLRPGQSLDFMTYATNFGEDTSLAQFLNASSQVASVDNTLAVMSPASGFQFVVQLTFDMTIRRAMPTDSIPGLMDHF